MKYLAFDIEAANGYKMYSICSVGVVIADEKFNILEKYNIWINPKTAYNLNGTRKNVGIDLHLDKTLLESSPDFPTGYPKIRALLTDPQYLVVGHAVDSDVRMLNAACRHYNLPCINFKFLCTQLLFRLYKNEKEVRALSKIATELGITYHEHNSEDDAWMSLMTLKYLTEDSGLSVDGLVSKYCVRYGYNADFELVRAASLVEQQPKKHSRKPKNTETNGRREIMPEITADFEAIKFLKRHRQSADHIGQTPLGGQSNVEHFIAEMQAGMRQNGQVIPMIPTYITNIDRSKISGGKRILIDAGGTNFRSALGYFDQNGKICLEDLQKTAMPASDGGTLGKDEFYGKIAQNIARLAEDGGDIGFCFSYPVNMSPNLDGEALGFSKEVRAPEVVGTRVGAETLAALKKFSDKPRKIVILNDTVATLLGGMATSQKRFSTYLGYIYGTGTNVCCIVDTAELTKVSDLPRGKMLVNMECGGYNGFLLGDFDKIALAQTDSPTRQQFEKQTSGKYLSKIINVGLQFALDEAELEPETRLEPIALRDVSEFLSESAGEGTIESKHCKMAKMFSCERDCNFAKAMCRELIKRAAKMGAIVNAATAVATCKNKKLPVAIVAEGTTFNRLTGYRAFFEHYLHEILDSHKISFEILQGEELNLIGTLMATMIL